MPRCVTISTDYWDYSRSWPKPAQWFYLWSWTNPHVDGVTGIGRVSDRDIRFMARMTPKNLQVAWEFLTNRDKMLRIDDWYWVKERMRYTCVKTDGQPNPRLVTYAWNFLTSQDLPEAMLKAVVSMYHDLFGKLSKDHR